MRRHWSLTPKTSEPEDLTVFSVEAKNLRNSVVLVQAFEFKNCSTWGLRSSPECPQAFLCLLVLSGSSARWMVPSTISEGRSYKNPLIKLTIYAGNSIIERPRNKALPVMLIFINLVMLYLKLTFAAWIFFFHFWEVQFQTSLIFLSYSTLLAVIISNLSQKYIFYNSLFY